MWATSGGAFVSILKLIDTEASLIFVLYRRLLVILFMENAYQSITYSPTRLFAEFWEDHFKCRYPNSSLTPYNKAYTETCTTKEQLTKNNTDFEDQLQFVSDAVMAFAYALRYGGAT